MSPFQFDISNHLPLEGSVDLGYAWLVALLSLSHVNTNVPSTILMKSPLAKSFATITAPVDVPPDHV